VVLLQSSKPGILQKSSNPGKLQTCFISMQTLNEIYFQANLNRILNPWNIHPGILQMNFK
jgi:hypothetical protein